MAAVALAAPVTPALGHKLQPPPLSWEERLKRLVQREQYGHTVRPREKVPLVTANAPAHVQ
jgi:hypothetical protein